GCGRSESLHGASVGRGILQRQRCRQAVCGSGRRNFSAGPDVVPLRRLFMAPTTDLDNKAGFELEHVCRIYAMGEASIRAVDGVSLEVPAGVILPVSGSSGSGKFSPLDLTSAPDRPRARPLVAARLRLA